MVLCGVTPELSPCIGPKGVQAICCSSAYKAGTKMMLEGFVLGTESVSSHSMAGCCSRAVLPKDALPQPV